MSWKRRLCGVALAGGALSAVACSGPTASPADASNAGDENEVNVESGGCCNADPDPCCPQAYCGRAAGPDGPEYRVCEDLRAQCDAVGGTFQMQPDGFLACTAQGRPLEGGEGELEGGSEAGPMDAEVGLNDSGAGD